MGCSDILGLSLTIERQNGTSLHAQLVDQIRTQILEGRVPRERPLPSTRVLAQELGISRGTLVAAMDQLTSEGYLVARRGSGVFVAALPSTPLASDQRQMAGDGATRPPNHRSPLAARPFQVSALDPGLFPHTSWKRHMSRAMRAAHAAMATHSDALGWLPLRQAIAAHVHQWRNIRCDPSCVVVTAGSADAFDLIGRALLPSGARVVVENPGYPIARDRLREAGLLLVPTQVDERGLNPETLSRGQPAQAVLTTPSRQFPLGAVMPLERRLALLEWARRTGGLIIEDDFDSEYRYRGSPHPALASLSSAGNVVYLGSFSKVLSPAARLGFLIVPESKLESVQERLGRRGVLASLVPQLALADFISSGDLWSHIRKTRREYAIRQAALIEAERYFDGHLTLLPADGGLHLVGRLSDRLERRYSDDEFVEVARAGGIAVRMLSSYSVGNAPFRGVLLGFASFSPKAIDAAAQKLARILIS